MGRSVLRSNALLHLLLHVLLHLLLHAAELQALCPPMCSCSGGHREVDCSGKGLRRLPPGLQHNLRSLNLSHNRLHHLDGQLGGFAHLRVLDLSHNRLPHLPGGLPRSLWQLHAASNRLRLLDKNDTAYQWNLRLLDLSDNRLERAVFINNTLVALRLLNLSHNHFWTVPTNMPQPLETVDLSHNSLVQVLPGSLDRLPRLTRLYLHANRFSALPDGSLDRLEALRVLTLGQNPWACHLPANMSYLLQWMRDTPARVLGCPCVGRMVCGGPGPAGGEGGGARHHGAYDFPSLAANAPDLGFMGPVSRPTDPWWFRERWETDDRQELDPRRTSSWTAGPSTTQHRNTLLAGHGVDPDTDPALTWRWSTVQTSGTTAPPGSDRDPLATLEDGMGWTTRGVPAGTKKTTTVRTRSVRRPNQSVPSGSASGSGSGRSCWFWAVPQGAWVLVLHLLQVL